MEVNKLSGIRWFFESNSASARVIRTIVQGVLGVLMSYLTVIGSGAPEIVALLIIPGVMAVLSPIMAEIGKALDKEEMKPEGTD